MLTVVAIIGILAAILLPVVNAVRQQARIAQSSSNLRQLAVANITYEAENGHYVQATNERGDVRWHGTRNGSGSWDPAQGRLAPYLQDDGKVRRCPLLDQWSLTSDSFEKGSGGYGYNSSYIGGRPGDFSQPARNAHIRHTRTIMFATTALAKADGIQEYPFAEPPFWDFGGGATSHQPDASVHFRANGKALIAWMDGSVTREKPGEFGTNLIYGGDPEEEKLGWFGPTENNGYWNPRR